MNFGVWADQISHKGGWVSHILDITRYPPVIIGYVMHT